MGNLITWFFVLLIAAVALDHMLSMRSKEVSFVSEVAGAGRALIGPVKRLYR